MAAKKSYNEIVKSTGILGGVQIFSIVVSIIKTKFIAILLGPEGVGLIGILNNTTDLIKNLVTFGLPQSGVRNIAESYALNDITKITKSIRTIKICLYFLGGIGSILMIILASTLSYLSFGNYKYEWAFIWLSITIFLGTITSAQNIILQGTRKYVFLAKSSLYGSIGGLFSSIPLYYFWGINGIVPSLIITAIITLVLSSYYSRKVHTIKLELTAKEVFNSGKSMLPLGISMLISSYMVILASYAIRAYISWKGGLIEVGLFQAAFSVVEVYFGMVFTAMGTDYYPRLAGVSKKNEKVVEEANNQIEITYLIIAPLLVVFILCSSLISNILYSDKFVGIESYWVFASLGVFFKAYSFPLGFILFAKEKNRIFICTAIIFNSLFLVNNIISYNLYGLLGLGISYALNYFLHFVGMYWIAVKVVGYKINNVIMKVLGICFLFNIVAILCNKIITIQYLYITISIFLIIASAYYCIYELNKRVSILTKIKNYVRKN